MSQLLLPVNVNQYHNQQTTIIREKNSRKYHGYIQTRMTLLAETIFMDLKKKESYDFFQNQIVDIMILKHYSISI